MTMKLYYSPASPYVRKVLVTAIETGQRDGIEIVPADTSDLSGPLQQANPLGKVPVLVLEDGRSIFDSRVICEYLDSQHGGARLFPDSGEPRLTAITLQAAADGIMDAALLIVMEGRRPEEFRFDGWLARHRQKIAQGLDYLETQAGTLADGGLTIAQIAAGCMLEYCEYRNIISDWKADHPKLAAWYEGFRQRPAMQETAPPPA